MIYLGLQKAFGILGIMAKCPGICPAQEGIFFMAFLGHGL